MTTRINDKFYVSPQILPGQVKDLADKGIKLIVNNRPEGEEPGQPTGSDIEQAATQAGINYIAIPVGQAGISQDDLESFLRAIDSHDGASIGFCKSGFRSTVLRAFALAYKGTPADEIISEALDAGIDISMQRPALEAIAQQNGA